MALTPQAFITKWQNSPIKERAGAQAHFLDLCRMLNEPEPADIDPTGKDYGFEVGASKTTGGNGFADVFKRGHFGWEYKGTKANLDTAFAQLQRYAIALDNPPLLIVSDIGTTIRIHTNWTNSVSQVYEIAIADLGDPEKRGWLKAALSDPEALRPAKTRQQLTEEVAGEFADLARSLRARGHKAVEVAHFINRLVFCMFAEDVKLLPDNIFMRMLERALEDPTEFESFARDLFNAMKKGGRVGFEKVAWFNGGLFNDDLVFSLTKDEIKLVHSASQQYWGDIDPSILGTLFERGLDPDKRSQLGAHYTDRDKIMMIINPVIVEPLSAEWDAAKVAIGDHLSKAAASKGAPATRARNNAQALLQRHLKRLADFRVLDPACGSGNFLYLALRSLKDLEHKAQVEAEAMGLPIGFPQIGPEVVKGIEINPYAAELARVSVWIGEIQWMIKNGFAASANPVLKPLETIECRDALSTWEEEGEGKPGRWVEAQWPAADVIIGNPPFLGAVKFLRELGDEPTGRLRALYGSEVPGSADLVTYWFEKARRSTDQTQAVGFVSTSSIRRSNNSVVLRSFADRFHLSEVWSDLPWVQEGAAVRVALVCGQRLPPTKLLLDGLSVKTITGFLSESTEVPVQLAPNTRAIFRGPPKVGPFDVSGELARKWLQAPLNPNGKSNAHVLRPLWNAYDLARRPRDQWVIDFDSMKQSEAALFQEPFSYVEEHVRPFRATNRREWRKNNWWLHAETVPALRKAMKGHQRVLVTPMVAKHRLFRWMPASVLPDQRLMSICVSDDAFFGLLSSRYHELWSLTYCSWHGAGNDPVYNAGAVFGTFPFPEGVTDELGITSEMNELRSISQRLNELREKWLNPSDLVRHEPEVVPGYPNRILPVNEDAADTLKKRTLTNLYNERPTWLQHAHAALDEAVAKAYGWPIDLSDDEVMERLFALNGRRAEAEHKASMAKTKRPLKPVAGVAQR